MLQSFDVLARVWVCTSLTRTLSPVQTPCLQKLLLSLHPSKGRQSLSELNQPR